MARSKSKKGPTKEEKEALTKKKNFEKKWLSKNYFELTPFKINKASLSLKQMKFGTILSHDLQSIQINTDIIQLKSSWTELILIMLSQIIDEHPDKFKDMLGRFAVTNVNFNVEKVYGSYNFEGQKYQVFKIFDTGYYLEAILDPRTIFNTLVSLIRMMEIDPETLRFNIVSKDTTPEKEIKESLRYNTDTCEIDELEQRIIDGCHLAYVKFFEEVTEAHRLDVILLAFCNILYDKYGITKLTSVPNDEETGICLNELSTNYPCARIRDSMLLVYTSGDEESIIAFMQNAIESLGINTKDIKFGFKVASIATHEWEVD